MKIIIAPAKKMRVDQDSLPYEQLPQYLSAAQQLLDALRRLTYAQARQLWQCSERVARPNYEWLTKMDLRRQLTPALLAFSGIQYQYMAPDLFTGAALAYVRQHLRIMSGFYGILRPFDGVVPYRLEMQSQLTVAGSKNLYHFWGARLYQALSEGTEPIVNLASQEYSKAITPYLRPQQQLVTVVFASVVAGQLKTKATLAKMARGELVRFMAEQQVSTIAGIKRFDHPDWQYVPAASSAERIVFVYRTH